MATAALVSGARPRDTRGMATPDRTTRDAPDLPVLPPVIPLAGLALAVLLGWLLPLGYLPPPLAPVASIVGLLLLATGFGVAIAGGMAFRRAQTNVDPRKPSLVLVETGPYRLTRNPMYAGFLLAFAGIGLIASLDWSLPLLPLVWLGLHHLVVLREEDYLARRFGAPYEAFRARTRRWLW